jgi:hypothetical protein
MNTYDLVEWQKLSPSGLVFPWLTHPFLDLVETWDLSDKTMLEFGAGRGSAYWWSKCKWVDSIESNSEWAMKACDDIGNCLLHNKGRMHYVNVADGIDEQAPIYFDAVPKETKYDIILVDGLYRNESLQWAIDHFKGREGTLIVDNMDQDFVWISSAANELMAPYPCEIYYQPGHINHEGKPWNTRIYQIPA